MDQTQYEIAMAVVGLGCEATGKFRTILGTRCAVGDLYATIDPSWALGHGSDLYSKWGGNIPLEVARAFSLTPKEVEGLMGINDRAEDVETRRERVKQGITRRFRKYGL